MSVKVFGPYTAFTEMLSSFFLALVHEYGVNVRLIFAQGTTRFVPWWNPRGSVFASCLEKRALGGW